jgi:hypothetical protein
MVQETGYEYEIKQTNILPSTDTKKINSKKKKKDDKPSSNTTTNKKYWMSDKNAKQCFDCNKLFQLFRRRQ